MTDKKMAAFPVAKSEYNSSNQYGEPHQVGMTLRDYFAAKAMAGDFASQGVITGEITNETPDEWMVKRASTYYRMADAMISARDK